MQHYKVKYTGVKIRPFGSGLTDPKQYISGTCKEHGNVIALNEGVTEEDVLNETFTLEPVDCTKLAVDVPEPVEEQGL